MDEIVSDIKKTIKILEDLKNKPENINSEELQENIKKLKQQIDDYCDDFLNSSWIRKSYNDNDIFNVCALLRHQFNEVMTIQKFKVVTEKKWTYENEFNPRLQVCRYLNAWKIQFNTQIESYKQCELKFQFTNNWKHGRVYFKTEVIQEREINLFSDKLDESLIYLFPYPEVVGRKMAILSSSPVDKNLKSLYYFKMNDCLQFMILELIHDKCLSDPKTYNGGHIYNWIHNYMISPKISGVKDLKDLLGDY